MYVTTYFVTDCFQIIIEIASSQNATMKTDSIVVSVNATTTSSATVTTAALSKSTATVTRSTCTSLVSQGQESTFELTSENKCKKIYTYVCMYVCSYIHTYMYKFMYLFSYIILLQKNKNVTTYEGHLANVRIHTYVGTVTYVRLYVAVA